MYGYVYLTTNKINGKKYIGQHVSDKFDSSYIGSGKLIKQAISKYGKNSFDCEILVECSSQEELDEAERYYIEQVSAYSNDDYYNIALGGKCCQLEYQTEETKRKIGLANSGKVRSDAVKEHMREVCTGSHWMNNGTEQSYVLSKDIKNYLDNGFVFGMLPGRKSSPATDERKRNISNALKGKQKSAEQVEKHRQSLKNNHSHWYTNGKDNLLLKENDIIPDGFHRGKVVSDEFKAKVSNSCKGRVPWNKGKTLK